MAEQKQPVRPDRVEPRQRGAGYQPEPIPWHFKLLGLLLVPYLLFRFYQMFHWLFTHLF